MDDQHTTTGAEPLEGGPKSPTVSGFRRIEQSLRRWRLISGALLTTLILTLTVGSMAGWVWIAGEDRRAVERWESETFENVLDRHFDRQFSRRGTAEDADMKRLEHKIDEQADQLRELQRTVNELRGYVSAQYGDAP